VVPAISASTRGPYRKGVERREAIVAAAARVFGEFGYHGASLRTIAGDVGTTSASLLQHFGSKKGLLEAVLDDWDAETGRIADDRLRGLDYYESLRGVMRYHLTHRGLVELFLTMAAEASSPSHPARDYIVQRYATITQIAVKHLQEACDLEQLAPLTREEMVREVHRLFAFMDGLELHWLSDPTVDLVGLFDVHLDLTIAHWKAPLEKH
jgi:AcrR family transcriptional regulator